MIYRKLSAPISCQIELTSECQLDCVHCYNHWRGQKEIEKNLMTEEVVEETINQLLSNGIFQITLTGGEPLLNRKALFRALEMLKTEKIELGLNSNLIEFNNADVKALRNAKVNSILTSFASCFADHNDYIMQRSGAQKKIIEGIKLALSSGFVIGCSMVVTRLNIDDIVNTGLFLQDLGVNNFYATRGSPPVNSKNFQELMISDDELLKTLDDLSVLQNKHGLKVGILECYPLCGYRLQNKYSFTVGKRCSAGSTACTVGSLGDIRTCSHSNLVYGNIFIDGLSKTWDNMLDWRDGSRLPKTCIDCCYFINCSGGCRVDAEFCNKAPNSFDPYAKPGRAIEIKLEKDVPLSDIPLEQKLFVKELKHRKEEDAVLCSSLESIHSPVLITQETFEFLQVFQKKHFTTTEMSDIIKLDIASCEKLCKYLLRDDLLSVHSI
jgi:radical SAM protein with 4Fe4S-binding SPASM domain